MNVFRIFDFSFFIVFVEKYESNFICKKIFFAIDCNVLFQISYTQSMFDDWWYFFCDCCKYVEFIIRKSYNWKRYVQMFVQIFDDRKKSFVIIQFFIFEKNLFRIKKRVQTNDFCTNDQRHSITIDFVNTIYYHDFFVDSKHIHERFVDSIHIKKIFRHWIQFHTNSSLIEIVLKIHIENLNENFIVYFIRSNELQNVRNISNLNYWIVEIIVIVFDVDKIQNFRNFLIDFVLNQNIFLNVKFFHELISKFNVKKLNIFFVIVSFDIDSLECSRIVFEFRNDLKKTICTFRNDVSIFFARIIFHFLIFSTAKICDNLFVFLFHLKFLVTTTYFWFLMKLLTIFKNSKTFAYWFFKNDDVMISSIDSNSLMIKRRRTKIFVVILNETTRCWKCKNDA